MPRNGGLGRRDADGDDEGRRWKYERARGSGSSGGMKMRGLVAARQKVPWPWRFVGGAEVEREIVSCLSLGREVRV